MVWGSDCGDWDLAARGLPLRQRPKPGFGSTDGVLAGAGGLTGGVVVVAGGSTDGALVLAEVDGSIDGERQSGSICVSEENYPSLRILPSALAETAR